MAFSSHFKASMSLNSASFEQGLKKAQGKVKSFNKDLSGMFTRFLGATAVVAFGKSVLDSTAKLGDMSKRLGVSTDFLQKFNYAMEQNGVNADQAQVGLQRFIRRIGTAREEGGALKAELDKMNISLSKSNGTAKSGEELFKEFADGLGKIQNPSAKLATAFKFLDSEGVSMLQTIGGGSEKFNALGKEAENLGLIIDGTTITSMQDLDAELKKSSTKFKVLGAKILPTLLKYINMAVVGWEGIIEVLKTAVTGFELLGKTISGYVIDTFNKLDAKIGVFVARINKAIVDIAPFSSDKDIALAQKHLDKVEKAYAQTAKNTSKSFMQTRDDILRKDEDLNNRRKGHIKNLKRIHKESNDLMKGRNKLDLEDNEILKDNQNQLEKVLSTRNEISKKLLTQVERIKALEKGGKAELDLVIQRQKAEDQIIKLMDDGQLTREDATAQVQKLLDLEKQEKNILEQITQEEKNREEVKKRMVKDNAIILKLQEEKRFQEEIEKITERINQARKDGNKNVEILLANRKINLIADREELENRDKVKKKLREELGELKEKRNVQNAELQILDLIAQGRDKEAKALQASLDIQKQIKGIQDDLKVNEAEALENLQKKNNLEKEIALNKLNQKEQEIVNNAVRDVGNRKVADAVGQEEKARVRAGKAVIGLDRKILALKQRGDNRAKAEVARLEAIKERKLELILDDNTKKDLADINKEKVEVKDNFDVQLGELDKRLKDVQKAEIDAKAKEQRRLDAIEKKKIELIDLQKQKEEELKQSILALADKAKNQLQTGFNSLMAKLKTITIPKVNVNVDKPDLSGLSSVLSQIPSSIESLDFPDFPEIPSPEPTIVNVAVDTDALLKESTGKNIETALKGKFVNQ
jgi:hypothetical protein